MPKEVISDAAGPFDVHVVWSPDGTLQLGVVVSPPVPGQRNSIVHTLYDDRDILVAITQRVAAVLTQHEVSRSTPVEAQVAIGRMILDQIVKSGDGPNTGIWSTMTRPSANRLIKAIRRARNHVYGADE